MTVVCEEQLLSRNFRRPIAEQVSDSWLTQNFGKTFVQTHIVSITAAEPGPSHSTKLGLCKDACERKSFLVPNGRLKIHWQKLKEQPPWQALVCSCLAFIVPTIAPVDRMKEALDSGASRGLANTLSSCLHRTLCHVR